VNSLKLTPIMSFAVATVFFIIYTICGPLFLSHRNEYIVPLVEECFKFATLMVSGYTGIFWTAMFGMDEALAFIKKYHNKDNIIQMRIIALMFHFCLLYVQYYGIRLYKRGWGFSNAIWFFIIAVSMHYLWNWGLGAIFIFYVLKPFLNIFSISIM